MKCPHCEFVDTRMKLHRHLGEAHLDLVTTEHDEATGKGKMRYIVACPVCGLKYQHAVKPRYKDPRFLEEYKAEIALVAFDQLLYHLEDKHPEAAEVQNPKEPNPDRAA